MITLRGATPLFPYPGVLLQAEQARIAVLSDLSYTYTHIHTGRVILHNGRLHAFEKYSLNVLRNLCNSKCCDTTCAKNSKWTALGFNSLTD